MLRVDIQPTNAMRRAAVPALLFLMTTACGDGPGTAPSPDTTGTGPPPPPPALALTPARGALAAAQALPLQLRTTSGAPVVGAVTWSLALDAALSVPGADSLGRVDPDGTYHAPQAVAVATTVGVTARLADGRTAAARIALSPVALSGEWRSLEPRVVSAAAPGRVVVTVRTAASAGSAVLQLGDEAVTFEQFDANTLRASVDGARFASAVHPGSGHGHVGFLDIVAGGGTSRLGLGANVREAWMPDVAIERLAPDAQASPHVLNLRLDTSYAGNPPQAALRRLYGHLGDDYDFIAAIGAVQVTGNRFYARARNATRGLGLPLVDIGAQLGSAARLQGVVVYPLDAYYDAGERNMSHELGHHWINFLNHPALRPGRAHWPLGDLASGVMGFSIAGSGAGGDFPFRPVPLPDGSYVLEHVGATRGEFNDLELYLMGLVPASEVQPHFAFDAPPDASQLRAGSIVPGPVTTVTVQDVIAQEGARVPAFGAAPTTFRVATLVFSAGRLLSPDELAWFDAMAARGAAETELPYSIGLATGTTKPWFLATGRRGRLVMRLR